MSQTKYYASSFAWGVASKVVDALVKFMTIPLLLNYFGKESFGVLTLAISTNAYMLLLDMGINTGAIRQFSQWIADKNYSLIDSVARTSISIYLIIGCINALILIALGLWGENLFKVTHIQFQILQLLFYILAIYSILNWSTAVLNQLLIAHERIIYIQKINIFKTIILLGLVLFAIWFKLSIIVYFSINLLINACILIPFYIQVRYAGFITSFKPTFNWKNFKPIFIYSISIFTVGLFQYTATQSRPIILSIFTTTGIEILSEYRIIEVFPIFVISIGGMITSILLPKASKLIYEANQEKIEIMAYRGTSITSIIVCILSFPIIVSSKELLTVYVGAQYSYLAPWLSIWLSTLVLFLYNTPISTIILATGKTKMLIFSSAIACIISIVINAILCPLYGVGSAVIGFFIYILIQMSFYYFYFNGTILRLDSFKVFRAFAIPASIGFVLAIPLYYAQYTSIPVILVAGIKVILWSSFFCGIIYIFDIGYAKSELKKILNRR